MHSVGQSQQQRRGNGPRMPIMYPSNLPPAQHIQGPPSAALRYGGGPGNYQQNPGGLTGGMKHHQRGGGNRNNRAGQNNPHRQQRAIASSRYHPYTAFRHPLPAQARFNRPTQFAPRTPAALMGTPPGMSQSEYEPIHSEQVRRDKEKLLRQGNVLAPSNTTQFLIRDHNQQTPSSVTTPTPTHQSAADSSPTDGQNATNIDTEPVFDTQSDETESNQDSTFGAFDLSLDNDFNDIYYQCRYERYASFSRANLLNEVLSLCANIDRLQYEKSEVEKRLRDVQQHVFELTGSSKNQNQMNDSNEQNPLANEENVEEESRAQTVLTDQAENEPVDQVETTHTNEENPSESSSQIVENDRTTNEEIPVENNDNEQQIVTN